MTLRSGKFQACVRNHGHVCSTSDQKAATIARLGFDPRTFELWAQHASSAPASKLIKEDTTNILISSNKRETVAIYKLSLISILIPVIGTIHY